MNQQSKITANSKNRASDLTGERTGVQGVEPRKASPPRTPRRTRKVTTLDMPTKDKVPNYNQMGVPQDPLSEKPNPPDPLNYRLLRVFQVAALTK